MDVKKLEQNAIDEIEKKGVVESIALAVDRIVQESITRFACNILGHTAQYDPQLGLAEEEILLRKALERCGIDGSASTSMSEPQKQCFPHNYVQMQGNDRVEQLIFCKDCGHVINAVVAGTTAVVVKDAKGLSRRLVAGEFVVDS